MRFTIRDMLLLTVIAGLSLGWWLDHRRFGLAPDHLQTLIDILASHGITVRLESKGVHAEVTPGNHGSWSHYQGFGAIKSDP